VARRSRVLQLASCVVISALVLSACAAAASPVPAAPTAAPAASSAPASAAASQAPAGPRLAGKRECISSIINIEILNIFYDDMKAEINNAGLGIQVTIVDAKGDIVKQLQDVQQMVAGSDCDAIATVTSITPEAVAGWQKAADDSKAKGVCFVNHSSETVNDAVNNISQPSFKSGTLLGTVAGKWAKANNNKGPVLTTRNTVSANLSGITDAFIAAFKAEDPEPSIQFFDADAHAGTIEEGAKVGGSLLAAHPDASVFLAWGADDSVGATQAATEAGKTDPTKFWMGTTNVTDAQVHDIIGGKSVLQAAAIFTYRFSAIAFQRALERCMLAESGIPPTGTVEPLVITKDNGADYILASNHQFLPENQHWFDDTTKWWATPVKTLQSYPPDSEQIPWAGALTSP
jgi:ABC-type sugar transport system substrate-binding protein